MTSVIDYISANYVNLIIIVVLIFLAVIGYFAEKASNTQKNKNKEENNSFEKEPILEPSDVSLETKSKTDEVNKVETTVYGRNFDPQTGEPILNEEPPAYGRNFDPQTGEPILNEEPPDYGRNYDPQTGEPILNEEPLTYGRNFDPQTGEPILKDDVTSQKSPFTENEENVDQINNDQEISNVQTFDFEQSEKPSNLEEQLIEGYDKAQSVNDLKEDIFNQFDLEIDSLLPKKEIIETDLLSDIESLELEKTQKINLNDIPDLDNIDLPKIKQLKEEEDIWKF